ncbi:hypothetical protein GUITHDRAFT_109211 [Guillardia theta CCMP2712]|uniref:Uncharacterized protein n=1 Tax=Guillardia theta (strain CCMP2712) TaxID=905079 RepID=L1J9P1_GUITC|nr:hypothetical protein GUITHDRAFT_109211 [Guillardia theta CCMP2712]EKX44785.1 hypothetical protein GUITHDRAFT_109211 [Guillardia theta CCMP2712]|eukprot:XP_005831765.1 hypothetical protein GUITHDRAFT_109211 [Guillardia theta CCMP2712]
MEGVNPRFMERAYGEFVNMSPRTWKRKLETIGLGRYFSLFYRDAKSVVDSFDDGSIELPLPIHELMPWKAMAAERQHEDINAREPLVQTDLASFIDSLQTMFDATRRREGGEVREINAATFVDMVMKSTSVGTSHVLDDHTGDDQLLMMDRLQVSAAERRRDSTYFESNHMKIDKNAFRSFGVYNGEVLCGRLEERPGAVEIVDEHDKVDSLKPVKRLETRYVTGRIHDIYSRNTIISIITSSKGFNHLLDNLIRSGFDLNFNIAKGSRVSRCWRITSEDTPIGAIWDSPGTYSCLKCWDAFRNSRNSSDMRRYLMELGFLTSPVYYKANSCDLDSTKGKLDKIKMR